eukprot:s2304_g6.t1
MFIACAVRNNANLRALIQTDQEQLRKIAASAERRVVEKGVEVAKRGEVGDEFFIIREGSFDIVLSSPSDAERASAEEGGLWLWDFCASCSPRLAGDQG